MRINNTIDYYSGVKRAVDAQPHTAVSLYRRLVAIVSP